MPSRLYAPAAGHKRIGLRRLLLGAALLLAGAHAIAAPSVAVSVLPVHSLVSALMRGVGDAQLLVRPGQSPHGLQLKPSQVRALEAADLIVWVGPLFERALEKTIARQRGAARVVTLLENDEITLLPVRRRGAWAQHELAHEAGHAHQSHDAAHAAHDAHHSPDAAHDDWPADPHLWLSVVNARAIVRIVAHELARIDPAHRDRYESNARELLSRLEQLRQSLHARLRAAADSRYVVFHDAYQYFEHEFNLRPAGALTVSPERPPGAKRIRAIKRLIETQNIRCVFSEPQFPPALVDTLVADTDAAAAVLDPLGAALETGPDAWFELMRGMAASLAECLR